MWIEKLCIIVCVFVTVFAQDEGTLPPAPAQPPEREVITTSGRVRGFLAPSGVFEFLDIPYASVPTGPKKFGPPLPPITWQDTLIATAKNIICPQPTLPMANIEGKTMDENCLLTSIFAPETVSEEKLSVVVYVHGGAFQIGEGNAFKPYDLVRNHNIIAVTFNYRLGAHGFLCLGTDDIPGNAGMKDQVALLRWVQNNIASFGGNPEDVTIAGYSAGSASVDLLMLSKSTEGLFNKVIPESGANIAVIGVQSDPLESAKAFAKSLNFDNVEDINALEEFYKTATFEQLNSDSTFLEHPDGNIPFVPCVERPLSNTEHTSREVFLDKSPREILESGDYTKVPLLYGFTSMEGLLWVTLFDEWSARMNESFLDFVPVDLVFESEEERAIVSQTIRQFYFGDGPIDTSKIIPFLNYYTDTMFAYPTQRSVRIQVENGHKEIYLYEFNYDGENSTPVPYTESLLGAEHIAQTLAVFGVTPPTANQIMSEEYRILISSMQQLWANFIKTGKPIIEGSSQPNLPASWPPVSSNWSPYMSIGKVIEVKDSPLLLSRTQFWEGIYEKHYKEPVPPTPVPLKPAEREVITTSGQVKGFLGPSGVFEFLDIPYASVPTGPKKFGPPLPPISWQETLIATAKNIICPQPTLPLMDIEGKTMDENCLLASVFAPNTVFDEKLPVVVYVHGGAFQIGEGNAFMPYDLVRDHSIVAVTFNYRLGAHGFLCLGTDDIPGNAGMKDQVALLRWVQNNIASFGGNPEDVTIAGYSAGSASVDLLMLSKSADGLFNKVIPESGANIAGFAVHSNPLESAKAFAKSLNFENVDDINALEEFYKTATFDQLNSDSTFLERPDGSLPFVPCVERPLSNTEQTSREVFLDKSPREILESGDYTKVPLLYGFTSMEGLLWANLFDQWSARMNESFLDFVPADLVFESEEERAIVSQTIRQFYFGDGPIDTSKIIPFLNYFTDTMFAYPTQRSLRIQVENGHKEIYLYEFNYDGENSTPVPYTDLRGAEHSSQTMAIFGAIPPSANQVMSDEYRILISSIQQLWANFIKTGKPIVEGSNQPNLPASWPPVSSNWSPYMSIGKVIEVKESPLLLSRTQFWEGIYEKYYKEPVPPTPVPAQPAEREVITTSGRVRGFLAPSGVFEFLDIPYASVPTGPNKFGPPLPSITWENTLIATAKNIICPQPTLPMANIDGKTMDENCLLASVFAPNTVFDEKLPVVVYVHGGAFQIGEGNAFMPYDLVRDHSIVAVTFNYRLGAHGFLCLGTDDIPGNAGMKDQVALLRWVQNNIASFGGNPEDVTIAGYSAGSASVDLLMLSKSAKGLFNKVIPESGANIAGFAVHRDPLESAKAFAKSLNFENVDDINALEEFYKTATFDQLNSDSTFLERPDGSLPFVPCVERPLSITEQTSREVFLDKSPREILESGDYTKVPLLYGFTSMEGLLWANLFDEWSARMNESFLDFVPADLVFESEEERAIVSQTIKQFYFGEGPIDTSKIIPFLNYFTDTMFAYPTQRSLRIQVENGHKDIYLYEFNYDGENSTPVPYTDNLLGAEHIAQTLAVFGVIPPTANQIMSEEYRILISSIQQLWANFIKTGKPIVEGSNEPNLPTSWPPVSSNWSPYMSIGKVIEVKESPLLLSRTQFWEGIYEKYYKEPVPPTPVPAQPAEREVNTTSGWVRGFLSESRLYEFLDIPYATVPKGPNKFGPPLPPITWEDTLNATAKHIICPQPVIPIVPIGGLIIQEECLLASVFAPEKVSEEKLPVVVYVHGGAFQIGYGNNLKPYDLVRDHNIVAVTFNYRVGAHGFLCLGTDDVPGNAGMKDQVALLRWVQTNIASFGGNPEDVTLAGSSAGSAAADLLMLSKSADGLFNKVIPESGANLAAFTVMSDPLEIAKAFAKSLDFDNVDDINALEEFYKNATFDQLTSDLTFLERPDGTFTFSPCVERPLSDTEQTGREIFLDKSPREIFESGDYTKVPLLYGFANMEGLMYIDMFETWKTGMNENFANFLPADLIFESVEERENVSQTIKQFFFDDGPIENTNIIDFINYYSDTVFVYPTQRSARIQAQNGHNDIYLYEFNYVDENSYPIPYTDVRGAEHCGQTMAVFNQINGGGNGTMTEEYKKLVASVQQIWANFIKTGKPIVEGSNQPNLPTSWPPVSSSWSPYMSIGNVIELKQSPLLLSRGQFWEGLYEKYYREPSPPIPVEVEGNSARRNSAWISFSVLALLTVIRERLIL